MPTICECEVLPGLEDVAVDEVRSTLAIAPQSIERRPGALRIAAVNDLRRFQGLRSITAVYLVQRFAVARPRALLGHQHFQTLLQVIRTVRQQWPAETFLSFALSAAGDDTAVMSRLREELVMATGLPAAEEGDLLIRLRRGTADGWEALVRLGPRPLSTRSWRVANYPGALHACVAHAMARLAVVQRSDRVLNLGCGSGTLLIERLLLGPAQQAIGCDTSPEALDAARQNVAAAGLTANVRLERWDATSLPLPSASVNLMLADLPFGQLIGSHHENQHLYPALMAAAARVTVPNGRAVVISHEVRLLERVLAAEQSRWTVEATRMVRVSGMAPRIVVLRRTEQP